MAERASLEHFEAIFQASRDPWGTHHRRCEAVKRRAILYALPPFKVGRILELGSGNGSNSKALAARCLRLDACDGAPSAVALTAGALEGHDHAQAMLLALPARFPAPRYDAIVIAELLYYLDERTLQAVASQVQSTLRPGGTLVLCHHHRQFRDARQRQDTLHRRFHALLGPNWRATPGSRELNWDVVGLSRSHR